MTEYQAPPHLIGIEIPHAFAEIVSAAALKCNMTFAERLLSWSQAGELAERLAEKKAHVRQKRTK